MLALNLIIKSTTSDESDQLIQYMNLKGIIFYCLEIN